MSIIRDISLAPSGENKIEWVRRNCPLLRSLEADFSKSRPFAGKRIALSIHLEAKTPRPPTCARSLPPAGPRCT